jgi:26S proteasome regulatory subunit N3
VCARLAYRRRLTLRSSLHRVLSPLPASSLLLAHRTACLQHNEPGQAALSVCILRNYLNYHLYTQADTFRLKSNFPDQRSNAQTARYCYYTGKIQAVQLHYSDAFASLTQALRKAPQKAAVGFRQAATKLLVLVQLLMGDIPERSLFSPKDVKKSLAPYLALTQAVRVGDLTKFNDAMTKHKQVFERDGIYSLIVRSVDRDRQRRAWVDVSHARTP